LPRVFPTQAVDVVKTPASAMNLGEVVEVNFAVPNLLGMSVQLYQSLIGAIFDADKRYAGDVQYKDAQGTMVRERVMCVLRLKDLKDF
jgi:hypothetical protein